MIKKIVLAIDSFKGCLSSEEVENCAAEEIRRLFPTCQTVCLPVADGGEGILDTLVHITNGKFIYTEVHDPLMRLQTVRYGILGDTQTVVIEMAEASGLPLLTPEERNPMKTTSFGTGELIRDALKRGYRKFLIGIGGSATNDGGLGMLQALGAKLYDANGIELRQGGEAVCSTARIDISRLDKAISEANFTVACDVRNPFCGKEGATYVFAPQKGATTSQVTALEEGMKRLSEIIRQTTGKSIASLPGSGAAGGMGGALYAFFDAKLVPGADLLLDAIHFDQQIKDADMVITGEGKADSQTLMGKIAERVLNRTLPLGIPTVLIAGRIDNETELRRAGFDTLVPITPKGMELEKAVCPDTARENIRKAINTFFTNTLNNLNQPILY